MLAPNPSPPIDSCVSRTPAQGFVTGGARMLLRLEGFAAFAAAVAFYAQAGFSWPVAALFFLAPDLAMLAYLAGPRAGPSPTTSRTPTHWPWRSRLPVLLAACRPRRRAD